MNILFFTPMALRNGAEMMLWYMMKSLDPEQYKCAVFSKQPGELLSELPKSIPYFVPSPPKPKPQPIPRSLLWRARNRVFTYAKRTLGKERLPGPTPLPRPYLEIVHEQVNPDFWYINTLLCQDIVAKAVELKVPYALHVHELLLLYQHISAKDLQLMVDHAHLLIGCSEVVCDKLKTLGGKNIALQYECIDIERIKTNPAKVTQLKKSLGSGDKFVWAMSGSIEYRKGTDLFIELAQSLKEEADFIWLGPGYSGYAYFMEQETRRRNLTNVHFLGQQVEDYYDYLNLADGLVLTSREDPFPLVMLEAASLGKPIVSFRSGGVVEFLRQEMGTVVETFSIKAMVQAMQDVMRGKTTFNEELSKSTAQEYDVKAQVKKWEATIRQHFGKQ